MHLIGPPIIFLHRQFVQIPSDVIYGRIISVPRWIKIVGRGCSVGRPVRAGEVLVEALPAPEGSMPKLPTHLTLMILVRIVGIARGVTTRQATPTIPLEAATMLLLAIVVASTCGSIGQHVVLFLLLPLGLLCRKMCFSVEEARIECLRANDFNHAIHLLNQ
jgi:hypothetical protein